MAKTRWPGIFSRVLKRTRVTVYDATVTFHGRQRQKRAFPTIAAAREWQALALADLKTPPLERAKRLPGRQSELARLASERGWKAGADSENRVALVLHALGVRPEEVEQQFRIGPYRLDFAWPLERVAIEADGIIHTIHGISAADAVKDERLSRWGWQVNRIDWSVADGELPAVVQAILDNIEARRS